MKMSLTHVNSLRQLIGLGVETQSKITLDKKRLRTGQIRRPVKCHARKKGDTSLTFKRR